MELQYGLTSACSVQQPSLFLQFAHLTLITSCIQRLRLS